MLPDFKLEHVSFGTIHLPGRHTAANISKNLVDVMSRYDLTELLTTKKVFWVTDNAANMKKTIDSHPEWTRIPCFAHTLQLCVNDVKKKKLRKITTPKNEEINEIEEVIKKAKQITTHFAKSGIDRQLFLENQRKCGVKTALTLIQQVDTRWNSQYDMLKRYDFLGSILLISESK